MQLYEHQFDPALDVPGAPPATRTILIASTPRSGSHMLGHSMIETGAMGVPFEYCNLLNLPRWNEILGTGDLRGALAAIMARRTTANGVFSIKAHRTQLAALGGLRGALEFFPNPCVVRIIRADLLRQAVSMTVARQTGVWITGQKGNGRRPTYDFADIRHCLTLLAVEHTQWEIELASAGVAALTVTFEDVAGRTAETLEAIAGHAGIADVAGVVAPPTTRQSSSLSDEWVRRFTEEFSRQRRLSEARRQTMNRLRRVTDRVRRLVGG